MGFLPEMPDEAGEYHVEVRRESFYMKGAYQEFDARDCPRHAIIVYPSTDFPVSSGNVEILIEDIPKIRACLDTVEAVVNER